MSTLPDVAVLSPKDRYAVVAKTGAGKTVFSIVLATMLVPISEPFWEIWWLDTKHDTKDQGLLRKWGFHPDRGPRRLISIFGDTFTQAQELFAAAIDRTCVLLVADEYGHVVKNTKMAGPALEDVHKRGRGLNVGLIGQTQEPVMIPRQLMSQAQHLFLGRLTYPRDIEVARSLFRAYPREPEDFPDDFGFYHGWLDAPGDQKIWSYYRHVRHFHRKIVAPQEKAS